jgi:deoxyribonuclease V
MRLEAVGKRYGPRVVAGVSRPSSGRVREPPLRAVLAGVTSIELLVVDGYVDLAPDGRPGLGAHVHADFGVPVIGVAKTPFATATHAVPVLRGQATRPLYVTTAGLPASDAAELVQRMSGRFRLPDALRLVDALSRGREAVQLSAGQRSLD